MKVEVDLTEYGVKAPKWYDPINPRVINAHSPNQMVNYSTVEARIGTWIDGKPLYRRTYALNTGQINNLNYYVTDNYTIATCFIDHGASFYNTISADNKTYYGVSPYKYTNISETDVVAYCYIRNDNNMLICWRTGADAVNQPLYITIQYTKTTD